MSVMNEAIMKTAGAAMQLQAWVNKKYFLSSRQPNYSL